MATRSAPAQASGTEVTAWLVINPDETVVIAIPRCEMGQGVRTGLAMILAEELDANWDNVRVRHAPVDPVYGSQGTGGSTSTRQEWTPMRRAGAAARAMLVAAAAEAWGVAADTCRCERGEVIHDPTGRRLTYGALAEAAAMQPVPDPARVPLKSVANFQIVGNATRRENSRAIATGQAEFGQDVRVPGMLYAVRARCPIFGGALGTYDEAAAMAVPGVRHVVRTGGFVAVVAENTWAALKGREALNVQWNAGPNADLDDTTIRARLRTACGNLPPASPDPSLAMVDVEYALPFLAHAPMEPMNCTVAPAAGGWEAWVPTQQPESARRAIARATGVSESAVTVHVTLMGGGFGRRLSVEYADEAAAIAKAVNKPVQLLWTRLDDMQRDNFRPASHHLMRGAVNGEGRIVQWIHRYGWSSNAGNLSGAARPPYQVSGLDIDGGSANIPIPTGAWRSVANTQLVCVNESFVDELAHAAGEDPYAFRRRHLPAGRLRDVLDLAAEKAGWTTPLPAGQGRGIGCFQGYGSYVAHVVEVAAGAEGSLRLLRVVTAVDPGLAINPLGIQAQMMGGAVDAMSTDLTAGITIQDGQVQETSYADYRWLRFDEVPRHDVYVHSVGDTPGGIGEAGYPGMTAAVLNAIFAASGRRYRELPVGVIPDRSGVEPAPSPTSTPIPGSPTPTVTPTSSPTDTPDKPRNAVYLPWSQRP